VLQYLDGFLLDDVYSNFPEEFKSRDYWPRQYISIFALWWMGGYLLYLITAGASWLLVFDRSLRKHKLFLPNQEFVEMGVALKSIPWMAVPSSFIFLAEVRGHSRLYDGLSWSIETVLYNVFIVLFYLFFTDTMIYWIHRWLHHPILYGPIHKLHHKWIISTPFASHAFHPIDGFSQSLPYHVFVFLFPLNKIVYMASFIFVNIWTVSIHDNVNVYEGKILNGAEHHTIHHRQFNYNYGQYFTLWDRICGTHKLPDFHNEPKEELSHEPQTKRVKGA